MFSNEKLKENLLFELKKIPFKEVINFELKIFFERNTKSSKEGLYVYCLESFYHFVYSERGVETTHKKTKDYFELSYWVFNTITSELAFNYVDELDQAPLNYREKAFEKQIELFKNFESAYGEKLREEIAILLKE